MRLPVALLLASVMAGPALAERPVRFAAAVPAAQGSLVIPLAASSDLDARAAALDAGTRAAIAQALEAARFDYGRGSTLSLRGIGGWSEIVLIGTGGTPDIAAAQDIGGIAVREAGDEGPVTLVATGLEAQAADLAVGAALGGYAFGRYQRPEGEAASEQAPITIISADTGAARARWERDGTALVEAIRFSRDLTSEPGNVIYPESFVERTRAAFSGLRGVTVEVLDVPAMERLGMGAILGVGQGSRRPPRMLIVSYRGQGAPAQPLVLAGKGITFDSGGISLKPGNGMWAMKWDMAGAAAVVGAALSLARAEAPVNVVAIAALAENMPGGGAQRPGDVVRAMNGRSIEVINTDAEGRLVLADAVAYADARLNPAAIVDVATLTGAVGGALGRDYAGLFGRHEALNDQLLVAGRTAGEPLWLLPLNDGLGEQMKSPIADIRNSVEGGQPGASLGAHFIGTFIAPETPWAHLDIASQAWASTARPTVPVGATGTPIRLLDRFVRDFQPVARGVGTAGR